jgi:hypothetical protein
MLFWTLHCCQDAARYTDKGMKHFQGLKGSLNGVLHVPAALAIGLPENVNATAKVLETYLQCLWRRRVRSTCDVLAPAIVCNSVYQTLTHVVS